MDILSKGWPSRKGKKQPQTRSPRRGTGTEIVCCCSQGRWPQRPKIALPVCMSSFSRSCVKNIRDQLIKRLDCPNRQRLSWQWNRSRPTCGDGSWRARRTPSPWQMPNKRSRKWCPWASNFCSPDCPTWRGWSRSRASSRRPWFFEGPLRWWIQRIEGLDRRPTWRRTWEHVLCKVKGVEKRLGWGVWPKRWSWMNRILVVLARLRDLAVDY